MVTNDGRNNIIVLVAIAAIGILSLLSYNTFVKQIVTSGIQVGTVVTDTAKDINGTMVQLIDVIKLQANITAQLAALKAQELVVFRSGFGNLSSVINEELNLLKEERNQTKENLAMFLETFQNNSDELKNSVNYQTEVFVDTLTQSQNLTQKSQNLTLVNQNLTRHLVEEVSVLNNLIDSVNSSGSSIDVKIVPNSTALLNSIQP